MKIIIFTGLVITGLFAIIYLVMIMFYLTMLDIVF